MRFFLRNLVAALIVGVDVFLLVVFLNVSGWLDPGATGGPTPTPWPTPTPVRPVLPTPTPRTVTIYVVKSGEVLADIARRYDLAVQDLVQINGLSDANAIRAGQTLTIPVPPAR